MTADVVVVGAGPAGSAAALRLARAGLDVVVVDRARFPRDKTCGDGLTTGALRLLEQLGVDPASVPSWRVVRRAVLRGPTGRQVVLPLPDDGGQHAAVARRAELDAALLARARGVGADVFEGHEAIGTRVHDDRVVVRVAGLGEVHARYAVAADGMWSPTRRSLGLAVPGYRGEWHAFRQYVVDVRGPAAEDLVVCFEPDLLPGYLWSFPLGDGTANVGFGIRRGGSHPIGAMGDLWRELLARPHVRALLGPGARPEGPHRAWPIPARVGELPLGAGRVLFVGDAAAATDPMTGEGIAQALATGGWAADAVLAAGPAAPGTAVARYERTVTRTLVRDHRLAAVLTRALRHRKGVRFALATVDLTAWTRRNFARWLFEDYPRAVLLTPDRWSRGMLSGPGAFRDRVLHEPDSRGSTRRNPAATLPG